jgi:hypothetical protein
MKRTGHDVFILSCYLVAMVAGIYHSQQYWYHALAAALFAFCLGWRVSSMCHNVIIDLQDKKIDELLNRDY